MNILSVMHQLEEPHATKHPHIRGTATSVSQELDLEVRIALKF